MEGGTYGLSACIVGDNLFWDCNTKQTILRRDAQIGNSIRVASGGTDNSDTEDSATSTCSDMCYAFQYKENDTTITFTIEDGSTFAVSHNHLVCTTGISFEERRIESKFQ